MSGLTRLAADLRAAGDNAGVEAAAVVKKGATNVKRGWADNARASSGRTAPSYPSTIGYDITISGGTYRAEVGPDKSKRQGALGNVLEYGSANSPAHLDGQRALDAEADAFASNMARVAKL